MTNASKNLAPEEISSIDDLVQEGKKRIKSTAIAGHVMGPAVPPADLYFSRALQLMRKQGIQNPEMEFDIELHLGAYLGYTLRDKEAIPHFERSIGLKPKNLQARKCLAIAYRNTGDSQKSAQQFAQIAKLSAVVSTGKYTNYWRAAREYLRAA